MKPPNFYILFSQNKKPTGMDNNSPHQTMRFPNLIATEFYLSNFYSFEYKTRKTRKTHACRLRTWVPPKF